MATFIMLFSAGFVILQNSWIQTQITRKIANKLSKDLQTNISIGKVDIGFFNRVKLEDVLIEDQAGDTLIYSEHISTRIDTLKFKNKQIVLRDLSFGNNSINLSKDSTELFNFGFLIRNIGAGPKKDTMNIWTFACREFEFGDMQITYSNNSTEDHTTIEARDLNLSVSNFYSYRDSLSFRIDDLSASDGKGLVLKHASADVKNVGQTLSIDNFNMVSSGSSVTNTNMRFQFYTANDSMNRPFDMDIQVADSEIGITELSSLIPSLKGMNEKVKLSGIIYGTLNDLKGRNIYLQTGNETSALLDFYINDLFDPVNMYLFLDLKNSKTSFEDISNIRLPNSAKNRFIRFPESFYEAGQLQFKGNFSGFLTDFVTFGTLESQMGSLTTDILVMPEQSGMVYYRGNVATTDFQLGELFKQENLGAITLKGSADGQFNKTTEVVSGIFKGSIDSIHYNNYNYKNLSFDGILREKMFDGLLEIQDPNIDFTFLGELDLNTAVPRFDFNLNLRHAYPGKLNLTKNFPATSMAFKMEANFTGDKIDNVNGLISVKEGFYANRNGEVNLEGIEFRAFQEDDKNKLEVKSDFLDAEILGTYYFRDIKNELFQLVNHYVPAAHLPFQKNTGRKNKFDFNLYVKEINPLIDIFVPDLAFEAPFLLYGKIDASQNLLSLNGSIPGVKFGSNWARDMYIGNNTSAGRFNSKFRVGELYQANGFKMYNFTVDSKVQDNVLDNVISWSNFDELTYSGAIRTQSVFSFADSTGHRHIDIIGHPSRIYIADTLWSVEPFTASIDSSSFSIEGFKIHHNNQAFAINGSVTNKKADIVHLDMSNIDLSYLDKYFEKEIDLEGKINGYFGFSRLFEEPIVLSDLSIDSLYYKDKYMGDISLSSQWNKENSAIDSELKIVRNKQLNFNAVGAYTPETGALDFDISVDSASVIILSAFMRENFSDFRGLASGKVHLGGTANNIQLNGALYGTNAGLTIDVTQVPLTFTDSVYFRGNSIVFDNITVYDDDNNPGIFDGEIVHQNFQNMTYNLNFSSEKIKAMNTTPVQNEQFYGLVMANGRLEIVGEARTVDITCYGTTLAGTDIKISMESQSQLSQYEFLEFVKPETTKESTFFSNSSKADDGGYNLSITVEATPDADVQLIYNSQIGDIIRARGEGILLFEMDDDYNMSLSGNYNPTQGDYLFTLYNVMNKRFSIEPGGSIVWSGDPYNAIIDLQAIYTLKASLYDVFMGRDDLLNQKSRVQVECLINLSDELINPTIAFDIEFPNLEERLKEELSQYFSTEEELNKQILSLIVLGKFYTPEYLRGSFEAQNANMLGTTASELFSNQLSNWLSQIDEDWDIGINYRPGNEVTDDEIELALSTQIFNDRVTLNGNIGNNTNQYGMSNNSSQIVGDFEMSVKLVRSGKILFKAYNRSNNNLIYETAPYTQGIGLSFKEEYNSIDELFKKLTKLFNKNKN
ncbi:translocation/assembly module TamB domain-containing protein [Draconibacterium sp. IB214405]|uniref:translocation/assembly module TamB domain-containing protein n=1 Tax=Draconibacterium sp. IB214405 TaxID=3097352 RepID=UPI002A0CD5D4|nr:translocation/assembly module TamB domain-containing protein [Draconibacterium sp. IB214405]MDX8339682.1 translocation/assembly module TamB domain-containing protein [Draconibacterium sp. IB214405]